MKRSFLFCLFSACIASSFAQSGINEAAMFASSKRSYVEIPHFQTPCEMTVEAWVKTTQNSTGTIVAWKDVAGDGESSMFRVKGGKLQYGEWYNSSWREINSPQAVNTGLWQHVAITRRGSSAILYINGVKVAETTMNNSAGCSTDNLRIGLLGQVWNEAFDGEIDEVRIWSVARSGEQISEDMSREISGNETSLEGYWKFNGNADDFSSHGRNGAASSVEYVQSDVFDDSAPVVNSVSFAESNQTLPGIEVDISRSGRIYWGVLPADGSQQAPSAKELQSNSSRFAASGSEEVGVAGKRQLRFDGKLEEGKKYVVYAVLSSANGNLSEVAAGVPFVYQSLSCLPADWTYTDIGSVGENGKSKSTGDTFTVSGSGSDIWGYSDAFHYAYSHLKGDVQVVAHVAEVRSSDSWTKAGIMVRGGLGAADMHAFICSTPGEGINRFTRAKSGANTNVVTDKTNKSWIKLIKKGGWVATYCSSDGKEWEKLGMNLELLSNELPYVGFAVCGHGSGLATAVFDHVEFSVPADTLELSDRGVYFYKKKYVPTPIPTYAEMKPLLPRPVMDDNPEWVDMYYKAWEIGIGNIKSPVAGSPLVSNFYDENFGGDIFQWDMLFMTIFGRYAEHVFPGIESLDNFYCRQHVSGCITRCIDEATGADNGDEDSDNIINPPLFAYAELLNYKITCDTLRLRRVLPVLEKYEEFVELKRNGSDTPHGLYWNNGQASGMDNLPRDIGRENLHHANDHQGWADMSSQVVIQCRSLADICHVLAAAEQTAEKREGYNKKAEYYEAKAERISGLMNKWLWSDTDGFYHDVDTLGVQTQWKTIAAFWPMLADVTDKDKDAHLAAHLQDPSSFWRDNVFPALAADQEYYSPRGGYWCGGVWAPSNYAVIKGLEKRGMDALAHLSSMRYVNAVFEVYKQTGTFWENYAPEKNNGKYNHGTDESDINPCRRDFIGWTGLAPISLLIENVLGFRVDAPENTVTFDLRRLDRHGIEGLHFAKTTASVIVSERADSKAAVELAVTTDRPFTLVVRRDADEKSIAVAAGTHKYRLPALGTTGIGQAVAGMPDSDVRVSYDSLGSNLCVDAVRPFRCNVYDLGCRNVCTWTAQSGETGMARFSTDGLPKGAYVVEVVGSKGSYSKKLLID